MGGHSNLSSITGIGTGIEPFSTAGQKNVKPGFTLAEVLITLAIIGVVAAMTLPSVINNSRNKQLEAAFKRNYSVLSQALDRYFADYGERYIPSSNDELIKLKQILMKYTNVVNKCEKLLSNTNNGCLPESYTYYDFGNRAWFSSQASRVSLSFVLNDGSLWRASENLILIDTNGINKKPNRLGYDMFYFCISDKNGKLIPNSHQYTVDHSETCSYDSTGFSNGNSCAMRAITEKDYFKNLR